MRYALEIEDCFDRENLIVDQLSVGATGKNVTCVPVDGDVIAHLQTDEITVKGMLCWLEEAI